MVDQNSFILGYLLGRKGAGKPDQPFVSTRPTMPKGRWRMLAVVCFVLPAVVTLLLASTSDAVWGFALVAGLAGLVIGMYIFETIWERQHPDDRPPGSAA